MSDGVSRDEWGTPPELIAAARDVLGAIDTDPASNARAQQVVRARVFYTKETDGLAQHWPGAVWLNPPYSRASINQFVAKLLAELDAGHTTAAIVLVNTSTSARWWHRLVRASAARCEKEGRIAFLRDGAPVRGNRYESAFFYFGSDVAKFRAVFERFGPVLVKAGQTFGPSVAPALEPAVYTATEIAAKLDRDLKTIYRGCKLGQIPHRRIGRSIVFPRAWVDAWLRGEAPGAIPASAPTERRRRRRCPRGPADVPPSARAGSRTAEG